MSDEERKPDLAPGSRALGFDQLDLRQEVLDALGRMGFHEPTEVQAEALPQALAGRDLIVQSRTGTGKTAAFGIRIAEGVDPSRTDIQALVLTPTRELTLQVADELTVIGGSRGIHYVRIYGGNPMEQQLKQLREGAHVIVGTPGRILDHLRRGTMSFDHVGILVLDEADLMLDMGFEKELRQIMDHVPRQRQTLLFSATIPRAIEAIAYNYQRDPYKILLSEDYIYVREVAHEYYIINRMQKERSLYKLLEFEEPSSSMIFCNTKEETRKVAMYLAHKGLPVAMLSSDLSQSKREKVMSRFRRGDFRHLVATDVAARGIDIYDLSHVFIFSAPSSPDQYVHRAGRTGRIGKSGKAISLVSAHDLVNFNKLVRVNDLEAVEKNIPSDDEVTAHKVQHLLRLVREEANRLSPEDLLELQPVARQMMEETDRELLISLLLQQQLDRPPLDMDHLPEDRSSSREETEKAKSGAPKSGPGRKHRRRRRGKPSRSSSR